MEGVGIPVSLLDGVGVVGLCVLFAFALAKGWVCTGRELREKNARIEILEESLHARDQQVSEALVVLPKVATVLEKFHEAARTEEGGGS